MALDPLLHYLGEGCNIQLIGSLQITNISELKVSGFVIEALL